jgi:putative transposase
VSENTVAGLMREQHLAARQTRRRRGLTRPDRSARKAPDLLGRDFSLRDKPNVAWVGDLTDIPNDEGRCIWPACWICIPAAVSGSRWDNTTTPSSPGPRRAWPSRCEYTGRLFAAACANTALTQSMGRTRSALDNAVAESFHSTLEFEFLREAHVATRAEARRAVVAFLEEYNHRRRHSTIGMLAPVDYERARREPAA